MTKDIGSIANEEAKKTFKKSMRNSNWFLGFTGTLFGANMLEGFLAKYIDPESIYSYMGFGGAEMDFTAAIVPGIVFGAGIVYKIVERGKYLKNPINYLKEKIVERNELERQARIRRSVF